jgi:hypothetical protein
MNTMTWTALTRTAPAPELAAVDAARTLWALTGFSLALLLGFVAASAL